ncbi:MAG: magnesium transporter [Erysipelotrichaceae bacterium]|nr:magnesium transporter [Erysipelotrichaceae bacterium]
MNRIFINLHSSDTDLAKSLEPMHGYDIANIIFDYSNKQINRILEHLETHKLIDTFNNVSDQKELLSVINDDLRKKILNNLEMDNLKYFIETSGEEYLKDLTITKQKIIKSLLEYNADVVASIMTTDFITIKEETLRTPAINNIIYDSKDNDYLDSVFVVNAENKYLGQVEIRKLLTANAKQAVADLIDDTDRTIASDASIEAAIKLVKDYDLKVLPIIKEEKIVGIVTASDIYEELVEYHEETFDKISLIHDNDEKSSVMKRVRTRIPWLLLSVILNLLVASFLSIFEETMAAVVALALFQPMILGMSGNISTQSLAVTILKIHESEIENTKIKKTFLLKEFLTGCLNAVFIAVLAFGFVLMLSLFLPAIESSPFKLAFTVGISMLISLMLSAFIGAAIPLLCNKLKIDPVAASGPILTTINDLFSLFVYFGVATLLFLTI